MPSLDSTWTSTAVAAAYDFSKARTILDVGGGHGDLLTSILVANPDATGILFDRPAVVDTARPQMEASGVADRCSLVGGDFFEAVPTGGDIYILKGIVHDWDDEGSVTILKNCRRAMAAGSKLVVVEDILPPGDEFCPSKLVDVVMMTILPGRERTAAEYEALFQEAGLELTTIVETGSSKSILEGTPA